MKNVSVATVLNHRLEVAARRLGTANPVAEIGGVLERTFRLPMGSPGYGRNALVPGALPLEYSFSELDAGVLRLDLEPLGPEASSVERREEATREMRRVIRTNYGRLALHWFDEQSEPWRVWRLGPASGFGAFFGAAFDADGLGEVKVYYELDREGMAALPSRLAETALTAVTSLPGLSPLFFSIARRREQGATRIYLLCRDELRLLDLQPLINQLGIGHRLPELLATVVNLTGGSFVLPPGSAVLGLRETPQGIECKFELLVRGAMIPPARMEEVVHRHLAQHPASRQAMRRWAAALAPDGCATCGEINVVSVRITPVSAASLNVYIRPAGFALRTN